MWGLIYPFVEQTALYEIFDRSYQADWGRLVTFEGFWGRPEITQEIKQSFGSVAIYKCPTKRSGIALTPDPMVPSTDKPGPQGDYAYVVSVRYISASASFGWWNHGSSPTAANLSYVASPFQISLLTPGTGGGKLEGAYFPRVTFASVSDGLSNQLFVGEKHIPIGRLGVCNGFEFDTTAKNQPNSGDCSYLMTGVWKSPASGRNISSYDDQNGVPPYTPLQHPIARANDFQDDNSNPIRTYGFGSYHPGVCPFLLGDGAVHMFPVATTFSILEAYSMMDDGFVVALP